jgi:hypothetical protein
MVWTQVRKEFRRRALPRIGECVATNRFTVEIESRKRCRQRAAATS